MENQTDAAGAEERGGVLAMLCGMVLGAVIAFFGAWLLAVIMLSLELVQL